MPTSCVTPTFDPIRCRTICQHSFQQFIRSSVALAALGYPRSLITSFQSLNPGSTITILSRFDHSSANRDSPFDPCHLCQIEIYVLNQFFRRVREDKETEKRRQVEPRECRMVTSCIALLDQPTNNALNWIISSLVVKGNPTKVLFFSLSCYPSPLPLSDSLQPLRLGTSYLFLPNKPISLFSGIFKRSFYK